MQLGGWQDMPLYEYQCQACGVRFERRQHVDDEPMRVCPECGGETRRLFQPVGIVFKGKGFYVTDSRSKSPTSKPGSKVKQSEASETSKPSDESGGESNAKSE
jgi:putative FmdB family regulatory protein